MNFKLSDNVELGIIMMRNPVPGVTIRKLKL